MSSSSTIEKPRFHRGEKVAGWTVISRIGSGGFGNVFEVEKNGLRAAMKTEYISEDKIETLRNETKQLSLLQFSDHFCRLFLACKTVTADGDAINIMVMTLLGRSLSALRRLMPKYKFTKKCAFRLALQSFQAIEDMHSVGIIHRDIKASNFAWSDQERRVYLLDLGFCRRFMNVTDDGNASHRTARAHLSFTGTAKYCSIYVHNREEQSRRDDLWSWLYMVVEFLTGRLSWSDQGEHMQAVMKARAGTRLVKKCPVEIIRIYDHIKLLKYDSRPNYPMIRKQLENFLLANGYDEKQPCDFEKGGLHYEHIQQKDAKTIRPPQRDIYEKIPDFLGRTVLSDSDESDYF